MSVKKQMCVNHIQLPDELLILIKDFAFTDMITYMAKTRKNRIVDLINSTPYTNKHIYTTQPLFKFLIQQDPGCNHYQMLFCLHCGNYFMQQSHYYEKIDCKC
jgi:hypothetical protein